MQYLLFGISSILYIFYVDDNSDEGWHVMIDAWVIFAVIDHK